MKQNVIVVIGSAAAFLACGIAWLAPPVLQEPQRKVDGNASAQLEQARRLLAKYSLGATHKSLLLNRLFEAGVDVDIEDPADLVEAAADEYQVHHENLWEDFHPTDWGDQPRPGRASYGNLEGQIREGIDGRTTYFEENDLWLDDALDAVDDVLSLSSGDASSAAYAEAHRLKGIVLYHQGISARLRAQMARRDADPYRRKLVGLALRGAGFEARKSLVADSGLEEQIRVLEEVAAKNDASLEQDRRALARVDQTISGLQDRLVAAQTQRDRARDAMEHILDRGVDLTDPDGAVSFRDAVLQQDRIFREADRRVESLQTGTLPKAEIDVTGDLLTGDYVEQGSTTDLTVEFGLTHYRDERAVLEARIDKQEQAADALRNNAIARLEQMKRAYEDEESRVAVLIGDAVSAAREAYTELNRIESEAFAIEEEAVALLEESAAVSERAADDSNEWVRDARDRMQGVAQEARQRSAFAKRLEDSWMRGHIVAQAADARLAMAWIHYDRYHAYSQTGQALTAITGVAPLREVDIDDVLLKATEAHDAGIDAITAAMDVLQEAHADTDRHWTITAQAGGANYLLSLFGHPSYLDEAIEAYRKAVQGREDSRMAGKFVTRLRQLESR